MRSVRMDDGCLLSVSTAAVVDTAQTVDVSRSKQAVLANLLVGARVLEQEIASDAIAAARGPTNPTLASGKGRQPKERVSAGAVRGHPRSVRRVNLGDAVDLVGTEHDAEAGTGLGCAWIRPWCRSHASVRVLQAATLVGESARA
jgi:hypothetical protein